MELPLPGASVEVISFGRGVIYRVLHQLIENQKAIIGDDRMKEGGKLFPKSFLEENIQ